MKITLYLLSLALLLTSCSPAEVTPTPSSETILLNTQVPDSEKEPAFVSSAELKITRSAPVKVILHVVGNLPTPCNQFEAEVAQPDAEKNIQVTVYSIVTTQAACAQVLKPFDETFLIDIVNKFDGVYNVYVNGEPIGQIVIDGGNYIGVSL